MLVCLETHFAVFLVDEKAREFEQVLEMRAIAAARKMGVTHLLAIDDDELLYCSAKGGSNGKVGPFVGKVTQEFVDDENFINAVTFGDGAARLSLYAKRKVLDDTRIQVSFVETGLQVFGKELFRKSLNGKGVWKQQYVTETADFRAMLTPSIFVLRKVA